MYVGNCKITSNRASTLRCEAGSGLTIGRIPPAVTKWLYVVLCLLFVATGSMAAIPQPAHATNTEYLLDRNITWDDGTQERVQIGKDAYFYLDGEKKHLVGMTISEINPNINDYWEFWKPESLALLDKQLTYFQSIGMRLFRVRFIGILHSVSGEAQERAAYTAYLDVFYKHKMLVILLADSRLIPNFSGFDPVDFVMWQHDTVSDWAGRLADIASKYSNVVAVCADNELDNKAGVGQKYTTEQANQYITLLSGIFRMPNGPVITHNLMVNNIEPDIKQAVLHQVDVPGFSCYFESPNDLKANVNSVLPRLGVSGGWWAIELGTWVKDSPNSDKVNASMIEAAFDRGATVALLFLSTDKAHPEYAYFDSSGNPKPFLVAIGSDVSRLQAPMTVATTDMQVIARK